MYCCFIVPECQEHIVNRLSVVEDGEHTYIHTHMYTWCARITQSV